MHNLYPLLAPRPPRPAAPCEVFHPLRRTWETFNWIHYLLDYHRLSFFITARAFKLLPVGAAAVITDFMVGPG